MMKLENVILRRSNRILLMQLGFNSIKESAGSCPTQQELKNKELYLSYVEEVLEKKEEDLLQLERKLKEMEQQCNNVGNHSIGKEIMLYEDIRRNEVLLDEITKQIRSRELEDIKDYVLEECQRQRENIEQAFKRQFDCLLQERRLLRDKMSQFAELSSYEQYLNQLHEMLSQQRQSQAQKSNTVQNSIQTQSQQSFPKTISQTSDRKRVKIFKSKSNNLQNWAENDTLMPKEKDLFYESSHVMKEAPEIDQYEKYIQKFEIGVQTKIESPVCTERRLKQEAMKIKFLKKWIGKHFDDRNFNIKKKKICALYVWRLSACFDENIGNKFTADMDTIDQSWRRQRDLLKKQMLYPYEQLSLNRKKYLQFSFDHQRKVFHRKKLQQNLRNVIRNKVKKERLAVYYFFFRFFKNSFKSLPREYHKPHDSQFMYSSSSHILGQERISNPLNQKISQQKQNTKSPSKSSLKNQKKVKVVTPEPEALSKKASCQKVSHHSSVNNIDESRLKQYVFQKQRTQKILATQCVKLEGLIKMMQVLQPLTFRSVYRGWKVLRDQEMEERVDKLTSYVNGMEFKLDLFVTKCRLGIANTGNKISTIENMLDFTNLLR